MEPALDVVNRALHGDSGAQLFLERTSSIYVLDATDASNPKTYGCWNFIHQAMNEVERYEAKHHSQEENGGNLSSHARMLASMALKVARRGPAADKALVTTCISNASQYSVSADQSQWLIDLNLELREIVMGRIAAMAFDFSFYRGSWPNGKSAFADRVVMDTFCAILSANAVSCGPRAVGDFATEWIIPSSKNLPTFSVAAVVLHLALEGLRKSAPCGTKDVLQKLSLPTMSIVLIPMLSEAVSANNSETNGMSSSEEKSQIAAMSLRAIKSWCDTTDLSLPQMKHICTKVDINVVEVLSDAMYSESPYVIDALAELIETTVLISDEKVMSSGRMSQVRHIIQPNEISFQSQFSPHKLKQIESHEMASIVDELLSAIALQRFRFVERQNKGDVELCRNLARIASSICDTWVDILLLGIIGQTSLPESGAVTLLVKGASHPSVHICAICLQVLTRMIPVLPSLSQELLPVLQRRAIIPHHLNGGHIKLDVSDLCGVSFHDFQSFRMTVLSEALVACWKECGDHYMDSCTSAVEEFCAVLSPIDVSLQLEAALFCIEQISTVALEDDRRIVSLNDQMKRLLSVFPIKPPSLVSVPLTRERTCCLIRKYSRWLATNCMLDVGTDIINALFFVGIMSDPGMGLYDDVYRDISHSSIRDASLALKELLFCDPRHFSNAGSVVSLSALWEAVVVATDQNNIVQINDRLVLCGGIGAVIAVLTDNQRIQAFETMISHPLNRLDRFTELGKSMTLRSHLPNVLESVGDEIRVLSTLCRFFAYPNGESVVELRQAATREELSQIPDSLFAMLQKGWPALVYAAEHWVDNETVACGLSSFLSDLLPPSCEDGSSLKLLHELCQLTSSILQKPPATNKTYLNVVFGFMSKFLKMYGKNLETKSISFERVYADTPCGIAIENLLQGMISSIFETVQESLGNVWTCPSEQGNGQVAFESKPIHISKVRLKSNESFGGVLCFLTEGLVSCPNFLIRIPIPMGRDIDHDDNNNSSDMLVRRAVDSALSSLDDSNDTETITSAILFLTVLTHHLNSHDSLVKLNATEWIARIHPRTIQKLVLGSCGKYSCTILNVVAELLYLLLQSTTSWSETEIESCILSPLQQYDHFLLGDRARQTTYQILLNCTKQSDYIISGQDSIDSSKVSDLTVFLQNVWHLHQIEDASVLPGSDGVDHFIRQYS